MLLEDVEGLMGKYVEVEITSAGKHYLMASLVPGSLENAVQLPEPLAKGAVSGAVQQCAVNTASSSSSLLRRFVPSMLLVLFIAIILRSVHLVQLPER